MNYGTNIQVLQQQMLRGAEIISRESKRTQGFRTDGYMNMLNKYGTSRDSSTHYVFKPDAMTMDTQLTEVYEGNGLFTKIIDKPAEEALKRGFDLGIEDKDIMNYLSDKLDALDWEQNASQALKWTRLYGGALMVMIINDGGSLTDPVNWNNVRGIEELRVYERPLVNPDYNSIYRDIPNELGRVGVAKFGMPQYYTVSSIYGTFKVHESRCMVFRNGVLPENSMNTQYRFWGIPEYYRIKHNLQETYTAHGNGVKMLDRCVQAIYKMRGLGNKLLTESGENEVLRRLNAIDMARGILNTMIIDADGEDYDYKQMSMSGVREIIDSTCNMLSAVTDIPQTILFGRSPAGMNSTGEGDMENYYNMVERIQKLNLKANGRTLLNLIFKEGVATGNLREVPKFKTEFQKLWSLSEKEQTDLDKQKADTEHVKAQTAQIYVDMQALNPEEVRAGLVKEGMFFIDEIEDDELDLSGTEPAAGVESIADILAAIENGTEDTDGIGLVNTMETDSEPYRNIHTVEDIVENIENGIEDVAPVLINNTEIDGILEEIEQETNVLKSSSNEDGGPGSGNWGHSGRPGQRGGSGGGGGIAHRTGNKESGFSAVAKSKTSSKQAQSGSGSKGHSNTTTKPATKGKTTSTSKKTGLKKYNKKELNDMSLAKLKKLAEETAIEYYKSGKSGISFGKYTPEQMAAALVGRGSKTSLAKDIYSMQKKLGMFNDDEEESQDLDIGVGVLVVKDGKVLVAERSDGKGWCGPGGHMQEGEDTMEAALRESYEEFCILPKCLYPMEGFVVPLGCNKEINQFYCTDYEGEVEADGNEMYNAKFVSLEELQTLPLFPPFAQALEKFLQLITGNDSIFLTKEGEIDTINVSVSNTDGGPGSGRYPKGSGKNPKSGKGRNSMKESLPMTAIEKRKVTHDINSIYHAKYKGKRNCVIRTRSNEPDSQSYYYKFKNYGFDCYDIYHKTKIE